MSAIFAHLLIGLLGVFQKSTRMLVSAAPPIGPFETAAIMVWRVHDLSSQSGSGFMMAFLLFAAIRYVRLVVHIVASWTFPPVIPQQHPVFSSSDCTIVLATVDGKTPVFVDCIQSMLKNNPFHILVVTPFQNAPGLRTMLAKYDKVTVLGCQRASKRFQQVCGLRCVTTPVTIFADDDIIWPSTFLWTTLAAFKNPLVGAVGTCQRLLRQSTFNVWDFLGAVYLERRNFECAATAHINGFVSTLSGRCQIIRTDILQNSEFMHGYLSEKWLNRIILSNADDDKFITRWIKKKGWKCCFQYCPEAELLTVHQSSWHFLEQCVRWYRTIWRGAITSMFVEGSMWRGQPWSCYANLSRVFLPPALIMDSGLAYLLYKASPSHCVVVRLLLFGLWLMFSKTIKLAPHFWRHPRDLKYLPVHFAFGYFHGFIKVYALLTVYKTNWSGRLSPEEIGDVALNMAYPVGDIPADIVTPGIERLVQSGAYEFPRVPEKNMGARRPILARRPGYVNSQTP